MRSPHGTIQGRALLLVHCLLFAWLAGCGVGTEIGNGVKPDDPDDPGAGGSSEETQNRQNSSTGGDDVDEGSTKESDELDSNSPAGGAEGATDKSTTTLPFDIDAITAPCASPLGEVFERPIDLVVHSDGEKTGHVLTVQAGDNDGKTLVVNSQGTVLRHLTDTTEGSALDNVTTAAGDPIETPYACKPDSKQKNSVDEGTQKAVTVVKSTTTDQRVRWILETSSDGGTVRLKRIELGPVGEDPTVILQNSQS